jgi:acetyl esterase/lipase
VLHGDIYHPRTSPTPQPNPCVIFIHGNWPEPILPVAKSVGQAVSWAQLVAAHGMTAITFNHRSTQRHTQVAEAASDVTDLLHYLAHEYHTFNIDPARIALFAFSAGALLSFWAAEQEPHLTVRCMVMYYGLMDLVALRDGIPLNVPDAVLQTFSPCEYIARATTMIPPLFVAQAGRDDPLLNSTITHFVTTAQANHYDIEYVIQTEGQHGFDRLDHSESSRTIIRATVAFLQRHLMPSTV